LNLTFYLFSLSLVGLALFPPVLFHFTPALFYSLLVLAGLSAPHRKPQLWIAGGILVGLPILMTAGMSDVGALGGLPWLGLGLMAFAAAQGFLPDETQRKKFALLLAFLILAEFMLGALEAFSWLPALRGSASGSLAFVADQGRPAGTFLNPNVCASFLILTLPLLAEFSVAESGQMRWFFGLCLGTGVALLALTRSMAALASAAMALMLCAPVLKRRGRLAALASVLALLVLTVWKRGFSLASEGGKAALLGRLDLWRPAWEAGKKASWFGYGPGLTEWPYRQAQAQLKLGYGRYPHDLILQWLLMVGLVGTLAGLAWLVLLLIRLFRRASDTPVRGNAGMLVGFVACGLHSLFDVNAHMPEVWLMMLAFAGGVIGSRVGGVEGSRGGGVAKDLLRPLASSSPRTWTVAVILGLTLMYRGGLMDWQMVLGAALSAILVGMHRWKGGDLKPADSLERLAFVGLAYLGLACFWSVDFQTSLEQFIFLSVLLLVWMSLRRQTSLKAESLASVLLTGVVLLVGVIFVSGRSITTGIHEGISNAVRPWFPNVNLLAGLTVLLLCIAFSNLWRPGAKILKVAVLTLLATFLFLSGSRGAALSFAAAACWSGLRLLQNRQKKTAAVVLLFVVLAVGLLWTLPGGVGSRAADPYLYHRLEIWARSWQLWKQQFWQGWGPGTYLQVYDRARIAIPLSAVNPIARYHFFADHAHNEWLQWGLEGGIGAVLITLAFVGIVLIGWLKDRQATRFQIALEAGLVGVLAHSLVDFNLHTPVILAVSVFWLALRNPLSVQSSSGGRAPINLGVLPPTRRDPPLHKIWLGWGILFALAMCLALANRTWNVLKQPDLQLREVFRQSWRGSALAPMDSRFLTFRAQAWQRQAMGARDATALRPAMEAFQQATLLTPDSTPAHEAYGDFLASLSGLNAEIPDPIGSVDRRWPLAGTADSRQTVIQMALEEYRAAEACSPDYYVLRLKEARLLLNHGRLDAAEQALDVTLTLEPNCARAWEWQGRLAGQRGDQAALNQALGRLQEIEKLQVLKTDSYESGLLEADWDWIHKQKAG
jgi:O-antigen ligase